MSGLKKKLDLCPNWYWISIPSITKVTRAIEKELENILRRATKEKIREVEIIHGKGSGQLKKRVLKLLNRKDIKQTYTHLKKDSRNFGRVFVYFRWNRQG